MGCRCSSIGRCKRDIRKIENAIFRMEGLSDYDTKIENYLCRVAEYNYMAMSPYNISEIGEKESQMNKEVKEKTLLIIDRLTDEKAYLEDRLDDMEDEDYEYHHSDDDD